MWKKEDKSKRRYTPSGGYYDEKDRYHHPLKDEIKDALPAVIVFGGWFIVIPAALIISHFVTPFDERFLWMETWSWVIIGWMWATFGLIGFIIYEYAPVWLCVLLVLEPMVFIWGIFCFVFPLWLVNKLDKFYGY